MLSEALSWTTKVATISPNMKHIRDQSQDELWKIFSAVWVNNDFKLLLRLTLELQVNESVYQPDRIELKIAYDRFQE